MRDNRFVAVHRGGPLTKDYHHQESEWGQVLKYNKSYIIFAA